MKANFNIALIIMIALICSGCAQFNASKLNPFFKKPATSVEIQVQEPVIEKNEFVTSGSVVDLARLKQGGNLAIIPFIAGEKVAVTKELDRLRLMIIKGIVDVLDDGQSLHVNKFNIITAENVMQADLVIKGYITAQRKESLVGRWLLLRKKKHLAVEGKMRDVKTGELVLVFNEQEDSVSKKMTYEDVAYKIGQNIGRFILSGMQ